MGIPRATAALALAAWRSGRAGGLLVAALSAGSWLAIDHQRTVPVSLAVQLWNVVTELGVFVTVSCLLAALQQRLELESRRGLTDPLTGLKNRRAFDEAAAAEIDRAHRHHHPFTLAFIDLDDFKLVNDGMGHEAGDQVLIGVADVFRRRRRAVDLAARLGGDEFALLLPETQAGQARALLEDLFAPSSFIQFIQRGARVPLSGARLKSMTRNGRAPRLIRERHRNCKAREWTGALSQRGGRYGTLRQGQEQGRGRGPERRRAARQAEA